MLDPDTFFSSLSKTDDPDQSKFFGFLQSYVIAMGYLPASVLDALILLESTLKRNGYPAKVTQVIAIFDILRLHGVLYEEHAVVYVNRMLYTACVRQLKT